MTDDEGRNIDLKIGVCEKTRSTNLGLEKLGKIGDLGVIWYINALISRYINNTRLPGAVPQPLF